MLNILLNRVKHTLHIQIHHLGEHLLRVCIELLAPGCAGIGEQDIHMVGCLGHLGGETAQFLDLGAVGRDGDRLCAGSFVGEGVESCDGFVAGLLLARGDVDFGAACLEEPVTMTRVELGRCV